jgi:hypothetical protein
LLVLGQTSRGSPLHINNCFESHTGDIMSLEFVYAFLSRVLAYLPAGQYLRAIFYDMVMSEYKIHAPFMA